LCDNRLKTRIALKIGDALLGGGISLLNRRKLILIALLGKLIIGGIRPKLILIHRLLGLISLAKASLIVGKFLLSCLIVRRDSGSSVG